MLGDAALPPVKATPFDPQRIMRPPSGLAAGKRVIQVGECVVKLNPSKVIWLLVRYGESFVMKYARFSEASTANEELVTLLPAGFEFCRPNGA